MDTITAQILVFGLIVLAFSAFVAYKAADQEEADSKRKAPEQHTLL